MEDGSLAAEEVVIILFYVYFPNLLATVIVQLHMCVISIWIATFILHFHAYPTCMILQHFLVSFYVCNQHGIPTTTMFLTHNFSCICLMAFSVFSSWQLHIFRACLVFENIYSILSPISSFKYKYNGIFLLATTNMLSSPLIFSCLCLIAFSVFRCWHFQ